MDKTTIDNNAGSTRRQFKDAAQKALLAPENFNAYHFSYDHLQEAEDENDQKLWLVTFTDVIALMLTFFVLLYSMSEPQIDKWNEMTDAVSRGISKQETLMRFAGQSNEISISKISNTRALDLNYLATLINTQLQKNESLKSVMLFHGEDRLIVALPAALLFETGSADISIEGTRAIYALGEVLNKIRNRIETAGHADPQSVPEGGGFSSNWDLSLNRAATVAIALGKTGYSRNITVRGLSNARFDDIPDSLPLEKRRELSRRVDIVIMKDDGRNRMMLKLDGSG